MSLKLCPSCQKYIPVACKSCPLCSASLRGPNRGQRTERNAIPMGEFVLLSTSELKLEDHQELIVPATDRDHRLETYTCSWCGLQISSHESRAEVREGHCRDLHHYHLGCHDAKKEGLREGTRLR